MSTLYVTGTVSISNGSTSLTGSGTSWIAAMIKEGDDVHLAGLVATIASVNSATSITLLRPWAGSSQSGADYGIRLVDDASRSLTANTQLLGALSGGTLTSLGEIAGAANYMPYWTGEGVMGSTALTSAARSLLDDASVAAMRTTLELVKQSSVTDATAGRVLLVGASATVLSASPALRMTYGGTANAITLTSGASISGTPPTGLRLRFRATSANTGATTIALDGGSAVACRTVTGVALPSGYIRTGVDTDAIFDGTYWVLSRKIERGTNANGDYERRENGGMTVWCLAAATQTADQATGNGFRASADVSFTYPAAFSAAPMVKPAGRYGSGAASWTVPAAGGSTTGTVARLYAFVTGATGTPGIEAAGPWY